MSDDRSIPGKAEVERLVAEGRKDEALKLIMSLIEQHASQRRFAEAEALHEKIYDIDPMALSEIVRAAEIIDSAKSESVDAKHMEIWSDLYKNLDPTESNALYYSMQQQEFHAGDNIIRQGEIDNRLFFINRGEVKAVFAKDGKESLIRSLGTGDIFGVDQFFSATVATLSLVAQTEVKVSYLESEVLKRWKVDAPALEAKLYSFCSRKDRLKKDMLAKNVDRRVHKRVPVSGRVIFSLIDSSGKPMGKRYQGEIADLSAGGLSFLIKTSKPESARMLLGRRLFVEFEVSLKGGAKKTIKAPMQVIAVQAQAFDDYSIHLKSDKILAESVINKVIPARPGTSAQ